MLLEGYVSIFFHLTQVDVRCPLSGALRTAKRLQKYEIRSPIRRSENSRKSLPAAVSKLLWPSKTQARMDPFIHIAGLDSAV